MKINEINLLSAKITSVIGSTIFNTIISLYILSVYGSNSILGLTLSIGGMASVVSSLVGGYFSEGKEKTESLKIVDLFSMSCCILMIPLVKYENIWFILSLIILLNINNSFSSPIFKSLIPEISTKDRLVTFNTSLSSINEFNKVLTPILSTYLYSNELIDITSVLLINALSYLCSFIFINNIKTKKTNFKRKNSFFKSYKENIKYIQRDKLLSYLLYTGFFSNFFLTGFNLILPIYSKEVIEDTSMYGLFLSFESLGLLLGVLSSNFIKLDEQLVSERFMIFVSGIFLLLPAFLYSSLSMLICCFILNFSLGRYNIAFQNYIQLNVEQKYLGQVFAIIFTISSMATPLGFLIFGIIAEYTITKVFYIISFGLISINAIWIILILKKNKY
ncbi:MFS transporter [Macrococcus carouselicus]|uniref:MFS transporter n=1 Tax=Macrococcus carouselicus TaxID=69969 RepID=A0A9Q8CBV1_9STAP|nr:MFS transporter [Macrococcus carouselicus]TDL95492.1 MFS transporter [Macrococcus carouselicus]